MIKIRDAKIEDAPILIGAEVEIARTPGYLASRPHELQLSAFQKKIETLGAISNGKLLSPIQMG
jgi:hypothetical protein